MSPEHWLLLWWLLFSATHIGGSSHLLRSRLVSALGLPAFKGIYSLVAFATFIPLCVVYFRHPHAGAQLFELDGDVLNLTSQMLMLLAFLVLTQGILTPSPITTAAEMSGRFTNRARGVQRITRHPLNTGFVLFGLAHCLVNPAVGDWVFFGGFVVYGIASALHQDARQRASERPEVRSFLDETSFLPFAAIAAGRQKLSFAGASLPGLGLGLVLFGTLRFFHERIFGGLIVGPFS